MSEEERRPRGRPRIHPPRKVLAGAALSKARAKAARSAHVAMRERIDRQESEQLARGYLLLQTAAEMLGVHYSTLYRAGKSGKFALIRAQFPQRLYCDLVGLVDHVGADVSKSSGLSEKLAAYRAQRGVE